MSADPRKAEASAPLAIPLGGSPLAEAILVVEFDPDIGHRCVMRVGNCSDFEAKRAALLALPDSHGTSGSKDSSTSLTYTFRCRRADVPLFAASALTHEFYFGASHFHIRKDPRIKRGFVQRGYVVLSARPYISLLKATASLIGAAATKLEESLAAIRNNSALNDSNNTPLPPAAGSSAVAGAQGQDNNYDREHDRRLLFSIIDTAYRQICAWPPFLAGYSLRLHLLGHSLSFDVPYTSVRGYQLQLNASLVHHADAVAPLSAEAEHNAPRRGILSVDAITGSVVMRATTTAAAISLPSTPAGFGSASSGFGGSASDALVPSFSSPLARSMMTAGQGQTLAAPHLSALATGTSSSSTNSSPRKGSRSGSFASTSNPTAALGIKDVLARKRQNTPGLFQEIGLYSTFRGLCGHLWTLWELLITGQPLLVLGRDPQECGDAILACVSLISPLEFGGDYRPFFSLYDQDFPQVAAWLDAQTGKASASVRSPKPLSTVPPAGPSASTPTHHGSGSNSAAGSPGRASGGGGSTSGGGILSSPSRSPALAPAKSNGSTGAGGDRDDAFLALGSAGATPSSGSTASMRKPNPALVAAAALPRTADSSSAASASLPSSFTSLSLSSFLRRSSSNNSPAAGAVAAPSSLTPSTLPSPLASPLVGPQQGGALGGNSSINVAASRRNVGAGTPIPFALPPPSSPMMPSSPSPSPAPSSSSARGALSSSSASSAPLGLRGLDRSALASLPNMQLLIGSTNPFFVKAFDRWPNFVWLGASNSGPAAPSAQANTSNSSSSSGNGGVDASLALASALGEEAANDLLSRAAQAADASVAPSSSSSSARSSETLPVGAGMSMGRGTQVLASPSPAATPKGGGTPLATTPARGAGSSHASQPSPASSSSSHYYQHSEAEVRSQLKVVAPTTPLTELVGIAEKDHQQHPLLVCRRAPVLTPDYTVLSQLLKVKPGDETGRQLRLAPPGAAVVTAVAKGPSNSSSSENLAGSAHTSPFPSPREPASKSAAPAMTAGAGSGSGSSSGRPRFTLNLPRLSSSSSSSASSSSAPPSPSLERDGATGGINEGNTRGESGASPAAPSSHVAPAELDAAKARAVSSSSSSSSSSSARSRGSRAKTETTTDEDGDDAAAAALELEEETQASVRAAAFRFSTSRSAGPGGAHDDNAPLGGISPAVSVSDLTLAPLTDGSAGGAESRRFFFPASTASASSSPLAASSGPAMPQLSIRGDTATAASRDLPLSSSSATPSPGSLAGGTALGMATAAQGGEIPAILINNAVLRQSFRALTLGFLKPYERYFKATGTIDPNHIRGLLLAQQQQTQQQQQHRLLGQAGALASAGLASAPRSGSDGRTSATNASSASSLALEMSKGTSVVEDPAAARALLFKGVTVPPASAVTPAPLAPAHLPPPRPSGTSASSSAGTGLGLLERSSSSFSVTGADEREAVGTSASAMTMTPSPAAAGTALLTSHSPVPSPGFGAPPRALAPALPPGIGKPPLAGHAPSPSHAASSSMPPVLSFGPYEDLPSLLLPPFDEKAFLDDLASKGGPKHKKLRSCARWKELYQGFMASPHFRPWFSARRREASRQFFEFSRALRLSTPDAEISRVINSAAGASGLGSGVAAAVAASAASPRAPLLTSADLQRHEQACVELHRKITSSFVREGHFLKEDLEGNDGLLRVMRRHLACVEGALSNQDLKRSLRNAALLASDLVDGPAA